MTDILRRIPPAPGASRPPGSAPPRPIALSAVGTALAVGGAGLLVFAGLSMLAWLVGSGGSSAGALRAGTIGWLVGHGSGLEVNGTQITATPLGLTLVLVLGLFATSRRFARGSAVDSVADVGTFAAVTAVTYAVVVAVMCVVARTTSVTPGLVRAVLVGFAVALVASAAGSAQQSGVLAGEWGSLADGARAVISGALVGTASILVVAMAMVLVAIATDLSTMTRLWGGLDAGVFGGVVIALISVLALPNLVLWCVSVLLGPGFVLGTDTSVTINSAQLGQVPGLPVLAALPDPGALPSWAVVFALTPLLCGLAAGVVAVRRISHGPWTYALAVGAGAGASAGLVVGLLVAASGGAIGPGRMAEVGPLVLPSLGLSVCGFALGGAIGALAGHYRVPGAQDRHTRT